MLACGIIQIMGPVTSFCCHWVQKGFGFKEFGDYFRETASPGYPYNNMAFADTSDILSRVEV